MAPKDHKPTARTKAKWERAVHVLVRGASYSQAAKETAVSSSSVRQWHTRPEFVEMLESARTEIRTRYEDGIHASFLLGLSTMSSMLTNPEVDDFVKAKIATHITKPLYDAYAAQAAQQQGFDPYTDLYDEQDAAPDSYVVGEGDDEDDGDTEMLRADVGRVIRMSERQLQR